jgi:hypothetical protein
MRLCSVESWSGVLKEGRQLESISAKSAIALADAALKPVELLEYTISPRGGVVASRPATSALLNPRYPRAITELSRSVENAVRCRIKYLHHSVGSWLYFPRLAKVCMALRLYQWSLTLLYKFFSPPRMVG